MGPKQITLVIATIFAGLERIYGWLVQNAARHEQLRKASAVSFVILLFCVARRDLFGSPNSLILGLLWAAFPYLLPFAFGVYVAYFILGRTQRSNRSLVFASSEHFKPPAHFRSSDYDNILARSVTPVPRFSNDDALCFFLICNSPLLLDDKNLRFSLEPSSCKNCWMWGAKHLKIRHAETPTLPGASEHWIRKSIPESRFSEVAELKKGWYIEIKCFIETNTMSPRTPYAAYLVYWLLPKSKNGFHGRPFKLCVTKEGCTVERSVFLDPPGDMAPISRRDGFWMELELSDQIFNEGDDATVVLVLKCNETSIRTCGLIVEGIELRPKPVQ